MTVGPAVTAAIWILSPEDHPAKAEGVPHSQVGEEIRPISPATGKVRPAADAGTAAGAIQGDLC